MKLHLPVLLRKALLACFSFSFACSEVTSAADLTLGGDASLTIDYAAANSIPDLAGGTLQLSGDTILLLSNCGVGDGKTYTLLTGVGALLDAEGNPLTLADVNNAASLYFDTSRPGTGFWADATLQLSADGILRLVRHSEAVKPAVTISTRRTGSVDYQYYEGVHFADIEYTVGSYSALGGAIYGDSYSTIALSDNGSVTFSGNTASSSDYYYSASGGAIYGYDGSTITLSNNGSVTFSGNTASGSSYAVGGAICGGRSITITLSNNGSVTFSGNVVSSTSNSARGGAIDGDVTMTGNGDVSFSGNTASGSSYTSGGAIYGDVTMTGNGDVSFSGNTASDSSGYAAFGGAIYGHDGGTITLSDNGSVTFSGNTVSSSSLSACGGAIYGHDGGTITLSDNGSVTFSGNTASTSSATYFASGGAIDGSVTMEGNGNISFSGNVVSSTSNSARGGAIHGDVTMTGNGDVSFSGNTASASSSASGGAIYGDVTMTGNGDVSFSGNTASSSDYSASGGAIYGDVTMTGNGDVSFSGNAASSSVSDALGGAIFGGWDSTITLSGNGSVTFSGNTASSSDADDYAYGGAIYGGGNSTITLSDNRSVTFSGNTASSSDDDASGGAIYGGSSSTITLSDNGSVTFSGNTATSSSAPAYGGAIYGSVTMEGNGNISFSGNVVSSTSNSARGGAIYGSVTMEGNGDVSFSGNTASGSSYTYGGAISSITITLSDNGSLTFSGNSASSSDDDAFGGAIYGGYGSTITLSNNGSVSFSGNTASASSSASGGAIYGYDGSTITLSDNGSVTFSGNTASGSSLAYGGAIDIDTYGNLSIRNNDSVEFYKNAEVSGNTYRLRSIYARGGSGSVISLSAAEGKSITFYDSVYIGSGVTVNLNQDYTYQGEEGVLVTVEQKGDIVFTGETTVDDLYVVKGKVYGTDEEVLASRTTEVRTIANLYNGRLIIKEGAIWSGDGITVAPAEGKTYKPTLLLQNGHLSHYEPSDSARNVVTIKSGATLEVAGKNTASYTSLIMEGGSTLTFNLSAANTSADTAVLCMSDSSLTLPQSGTLTLKLVAFDGISDSQAYALLTGGNQPSNWNSANITVASGTDGWDVSMADLRWDGTTLWLCPELVTATWTNESKDGKWNTTSLNWEQNEVDYEYRDGVAVVFGDTGAGTVTLVGNIAPKSVLVNSTKDYIWVADDTVGGKLTGSMNLTKKGEGTLTINTSNDYTGGTEIKCGTLVAGTATALGTGAVVLNGGTLEIGATGLDNSICNTGTSTLQTSASAGITHVLTGTISNTGTLTLSGSFDASVLDYETKASDERYALDGSVVGSDKSGFAVGVTYQVKVVDGGTSINDIATILHDSHAGSNALVLESDGYARANGDGSYSVFYLEGTDSLAVSTIAGGVSQHQEVLSKVIMDSGTLGVDQSITVDADGGSIIISKESELSGTIDDTAVSTGAGNYTGTISAVLGGRSSLAVGGGNIIVSGANSYTGATSLNNGKLTITHANALGTGSISAEGISSLSVGNGVTLVLGDTITNTGTLTLSGSIDASALLLNKSEAGRLSLRGERVGLMESGFCQGVEYTVLIVDGGSTVNAGAGISHKDYLSRTQLVLGEDGVARAGAEVDYTHFFLTGGDSAEVSKIAEVAERNQAELTNVTMDSGLLTVDQSITVSATGGSIVLTEAATLGGVIENTAVSSAAGDYVAEISARMEGDSTLNIGGGTITVSGANSYTGGTTVNGGALVAGNGQAFGTGDVVVNGATLDLNQFSIANKVFMNGSSTLSYADGASHIVLGSGAAVNFRNGYTLGSGKRLTVAGPASYTGALTLGGGTLELDGLLTVRGDVEFASGATTTLDISGWKGLDDGDVLVDFGSSNSGYADGSLSLEGIAGDWELAFDAATGVLTLLAVKDEPEIPDTPEEPEIPDTPVEPEKPAPVKLVWAGEKKAVWKVGAPGWENQKIFNNGAEVSFVNGGTVTIEGKVAPGAISVNNHKKLTFKSKKKTPGSISGEGDLTKRGAGTLTLNDGNSSWTGDTHLYAGTIKVKGTTSLGKGDVYLKGGTLNLGAKAIANDIVQSANAVIKSGKKFTGNYTLEKGELQKGSTLNIAKTATLEGGTVNGTLSGNGTVTVTGEVKLGDKGKIKTRALTLGDGAELSTSVKGLNSKSTSLCIEEDASLVLSGKLAAASLEVDGGTLKTYASKPVAISVQKDITLTDAVLATNGKVTANKLTLNASSMSIKGAKAQSLTVKQSLTIGSGSNLILNGKLSTGSLTLKSGATLTMSGSKPVTLKVKGALTLNSGSSIILDYDFVQGKTYKILTFGSLSGVSGVKGLHDVFGVDNENCVFENTGKAITLTVTGKWNPQTQQKAVSAATSEGVVITSAPKSAGNPVADALVQSNWGQLEASRAFVNAMANRSMAVQLGNGERAVWASAIGSSSRHSSAGGHAGADTNVSGGAFGLETQVGRASLFGMALGNSWTRVSAHGFGTIEQDTTHLGLYGQTNWRSGVTADWSAAYGRSDSETMGSDWNQKHLQLDGRMSYNHELNARTVLSPFAGVQYYASDAATVDGTDTGSLQNLRAEIGVAASHRTGKLGVFGEIAVHQDMARSNPTVSMEGARYTGMNPGRMGINFTIGASYELSDKWSMNASYTGEVVENANAHSANIGATYKF